MRTHKNDNTTIKVISSHNKHFDMEPKQTLGVKIYPSTTFNQVMSSYKTKRKDRRWLYPPPVQNCCHTYETRRKKKKDSSLLAVLTNYCLWWSASVMESGSVLSMSRAELYKLLWATTTGSQPPLLWHRHTHYTQHGGRGGWRCKLHQNKSHFHQTWNRSIFK